MKHNFLIISLLILFMIITPVYGQDAEYDLNAVTSDIEALQNPFQPKLPKVEKPKPTPTPQPQPRNSNNNPPPRNQQNPNIRQPNVQTEEMPNLTISGLIWNSDRPQAIINGRVVDQGDMVSNLEIIEIKKDSIDVNFNGAIVTIKPEKESLQ